MNGEWLAYSETLDIMPCILSESVMPDLKGMSQRDALYMAESMGLKVVFEGKGISEDSIYKCGRKNSQRTSS
jgi:hypothetical protein